VDGDVVSMAVSSVLAVAWGQRSVDATESPCSAGLFGLDE
jgi:hypothetical protein